MYKVLINVIKGGSYELTDILGKMDMLWRQGSLSDAYHTGDKVTFQGQKYVCAAPNGVAVVWAPEVYPFYWEAVA